jgi:hypothetical protein
MKRTIVAGVFAAVLSFGSVASAFADPPPPAPGNGGGNSGQCTGPQDDRPASCKSQGGPGN